MKWLCALLGLVGLVSSASADDRKIFEFGPVRLGALLESEVSYGCGCSFYYPPAAKEHGADVLQWEEGELASMYSQDELVRLKVESQMPYSRKVGEAFSLTLTSPKAKISARLKSSWVCPAKSESCEAAEFLGTLNITHGNATAKVPVWGSCGC